MAYTFGFIGCGNMGGALSAAAAKNAAGLRHPVGRSRQRQSRSSGGRIGRMQRQQRNRRGREPLSLSGCKTPDDGRFAHLHRACAERTHRPVVLVTMAAGMTIARIQELAGGAYPTIRIMPNTPVSVGSGMILYTASANVTAEDKTAFRRTWPPQACWTNCTKN